MSEGEPVRLNLGAGEAPLAGYRNLDLKTGESVYPLTGYVDASVDEIRASHILEHFSHRQVRDVLKEWSRVLKFDGLIKIAVPDFTKIAEGYLSGQRGEWQGYLMGGHVDEADRHGAIFDLAALSGYLREAGFRQIEPWQSEVQDCASLPVSLNLQGRKQFLVRAVMSVPRLGFMDNFASAFQALVPLGIPLSRGSGAFWGPVLERTIEKALDEGCDAVLTLDYDTVFNQKNVEGLIDLAKSMPQVGAVAALQQARAVSFPLMTLPAGQTIVTTSADGMAGVGVVREALDGPTIRAATAHFGCTIIKASALRATPKPWFRGVPDPSNGWGEGRVDEDIWFWRQFAAAGHELHVANRNVVGHLELMIRWPDINLEPVYQHPTEYFETGEPKDIWK